MRFKSHGVRVLGPRTGFAFWGTTFWNNSLHVLFTTTFCIQEITFTLTRFLLVLTHVCSQFHFSRRSKPQSWQLALVRLAVGRSRRRRGQCHWRTRSMQPDIELPKLLLHKRALYHVVSSKDGGIFCTRVWVGFSHISSLFRFCQKCAESVAQNLQASLAIRTHCLYPADVFEPC